MEKFQIIKSLGTSEFSETYLTVNLETGIEYDLRVINVSSMNPLECEAEANFMKNKLMIPHPQLAAYKHIFYNKTTKEICLISEHYEGIFVLV